jgi:hypothetical protein
VLGDVLVPVVALADAIPAGTILDFGASKFAKLTADAGVGDASLATDPIPTALLAGDSATVPLAIANPLLADKFVKLAPEKQTAEQITAEMLLDLRAPVYTGDDAEELKYAIVLQINFRLEHGVTPSVQRSAGDTNRGVTTTYRDRWIDPQAAAIVARVTGVQQVRNQPVTAGV